MISLAHLSIFKILQGGEAYYVEPNILTFSNHGCNGGYNVQSGLELLAYPLISIVTEQNVTESDFLEMEGEGSTFDPYYDRHYQQIELGYVEATKDISPGEEIFSNYLFYTTSSAKEFYKEAQVLKRICSGDEVGLITMSEQKHADDS